MYDTRTFATIGVLCPFFAENISALTDGGSSSTMATEELNNLCPLCVAQPLHYSLPLLVGLSRGTVQSLYIGLRFPFAPPKCQPL